MWNEDLLMVFVLEVAKMRDRQREYEASPSPQGLDAKRAAENEVDSLMLFHLLPAIPPPPRR